MTHLLEFVVALIIVFILAVIVGLFLPNHAAISRSLEISHNPRQIYDVLNNFRRFGEYGGAALEAEDPHVKYSLSGPAYGPGATLTWTGNKKIGDGKLVNKSGSIDLAGNSTVTWDLVNHWYGEHKKFTFSVTPSHGQRVSEVTWGYDVDYGWNLLGRYSQLWIHGKPDQMIQAGLGSLSNMLAGIPNVDYGKLAPGIYRSAPTPVLVVSTKAERTLDDIDSKKADALKKIDAVMKKLDVKAAGPTTTITVDWGNTTYRFDLAVPINTTTIKVDGKDHDLSELPPPPIPGEEAAPATSASAAKSASAANAASAAKGASAANAASAAKASSAGQPASGSTSGKPPKPGELDKHNRLVVNDDVRAMMMPAQNVLEATWTGEAGLPLVRLSLEAYAKTHGYKFDENAHRIYDQLTSLPDVEDADQQYRVFLPVTDAPAKTPGQVSGKVKPLTTLDPTIWGGKAEAKGIKKDEKKAAKGKAKARHAAHKHAPAAKKRAHG